MCAWKQGNGLPVPLPVSVRFTASWSGLALTWLHVMPCECRSTMSRLKELSLRAILRCGFLAVPSARTKYSCCCWFCSSAGLLGAGAQSPVGLTDLELERPLFVRDIFPSSKSQSKL
ncbi:hypothetical protein LIA77_08489 [Sarocladium implicatum]|nr:hypothetical protein LIA77_08489 [Sarocladium implicatum]